MSDTPQVTAQPEIKYYRPWVGVVLSILINGAGQFFSGAKARGIQWHFGLLLFNFLALMTLALPQIPGLVPGLITFLLLALIWIWMLCNAYRPVPRISPGIWGLIILLIFVLRIAEGSALRLFFSFHYVPANSMAPTIRGGSGTSRSGDKIFVEKFAYWFEHPKVGDIVAFKTDHIEGLPKGQIYLKRVVGAPGDKISIKNARLCINESEVTAPNCFLNLRYPAFRTQLLYLGNEMETFEVPPHSYFVIGDNSTNSYDSRSWGPVPEKNIIGQAVKIYWPLD